MSDNRAFWWMIPARLLGRLRTPLWSAADADREALGRLPVVVVGVVLPLIAIALAVVPSLIHALATRPFSLAEVDFFRIRVDDVYTESIVFMAGGLILGTISPALGAFFVAIFIPLAIRLYRKLN